MRDDRVGWTAKLSSELLESSNRGSYGQLYPLLGVGWYFEFTQKPVFGIRLIVGIFRCTGQFGIYGKIAGPGQLLRSKLLKWFTTVDFELLKWFNEDLKFSYILYLYRNTVKMSFTYHTYVFKLFAWCFFFIQNCVCRYYIFIGCT